jgi:hypothetical protein
MVSIVVMEFFGIVVVVCLFGSTISYTPAAILDEIGALPGASVLPSRQFSGFLNITASKFIHYYYIESENDPAIDSVVFWTNGGPGCSGLIGLFMGRYLRLCIIRP